jgi:hypothetical protein
MNPEIFQKQAKELASIDGMVISMPPEHGYMLAATVQAAARCLDLPETTNSFCKEFVRAFCDRYREQLPTVVKALDDGWDGEMVTEDEFEGSLTEFTDQPTLAEAWRRIAQDVQQEMGDQVQIIVDTLDDSDRIKTVYPETPHKGALCPINGEPCSKEGNFYYYPNDCPDYEMCEEIAAIECRNEEESESEIDQYNRIIAQPYV